LYIHYDISGIDTSRAGELALSAKHAFLRFGLYIAGFTPFNISDQLPQAECCKYPRTAGGCAGTARNTDHERRLMLSQVSCDPLVIAVVIDLSVGIYGISEVGHWMLVIGYWLLVIGY